jgi:malonate decarboxylase epsilon subunit
MLTEKIEDPAIRQVHQEAEHVLGYSLSEVDSDSALLHTRNIQLCLLICGVAWGRVMLNKGISPDFVLGLSVGAYPAAVISKSISFEDALILIHKRGELMQSAYPSGYGMIAINGTNRSTVEQYVGDHSARGNEVYLANINSDTQFVLSGKIDHIKATADAINRSSCSSSQLLDVPVPSHCELLANATNNILETTKNIQFSDPQIKYVSAAKARVVNNADGVKKDLVSNMSLQVNWLDSCKMLGERGANRIIQVPPGTTLTNLCRQILPESECLSASSKSYQKHVLGINT